MCILETKISFECGTFRKLKASFELVGARQSMENHHFVYMLRENNSGASIGVSTKVGEGSTAVSTEGRTRGI